jgi:hypothetical protein
MRGVKIDVYIYNIHPIIFKKNLICIKKIENIIKTI